MMQQIYDEKDLDFEYDRGFRKGKELSIKELWDFIKYARDEAKDNHYWFENQLMELIKRINELGIK